MITIVRAKAVSECMRIRRASVAYTMYTNKEFSLLECPHPLKKFISIKINDGNMTVFENTEPLRYNQEIFFYRQTKVDTGSGVENEISALGAVLINIDENTINYYIEQINNNRVLDQWNGEYEYLIGLYYEYDKNALEKANEWYQRALNKRFSFEIIE